MFRHMLCPVDGSEASLQALDVAAQFAAEQRASLTICTVLDASKAAAMAFGDPGMTSACYDAMHDQGTTMLEEAAERVRDAITAHTVVLEGTPVDAVVNYASSGDFDLIVMGSHGRSGIQRALLGSVAEGVLRHAVLPVMIVRQAAKPATAMA